MAYWRIYRTVMLYLYNTALIIQEIRYIYRHEENRLKVAALKTLIGLNQVLTLDRKLLI